MSEDFNPHTEDENDIQPGSHSIMYGIYLGAALIIITLAAQWGDMQSASWIRYLEYLVMIGLIFLAHRTYKEKGDEFMSFGEGLKIGSFIGLIGSLINAVLLYVYIKFIDTTYLELMEQESIKELQEQGYDQEMIEQSLKMLDMIMTPGMITVIAFFSNAFLVFILSLLVTFFTRKNRPEFN